MVYTIVTMSCDFVSELIAVCMMTRSQLLLKKKKEKFAENSAAGNPCEFG